MPRDRADVHALLRARLRKDVLHDLLRERRAAAVLVHRRRGRRGWRGGGRAVGGVGGVVRGAAVGGGGAGLLTGFWRLVGVRKEGRQRYVRNVLTGPRWCASVTNIASMRWKYSSCMSVIGRMAFALMYFLFPNAFTMPVTRTYFCSLCVAPLAMQDKCRVAEGKNDGERRRDEGG